MRRRAFVRSAGTGSVAGLAALAGCSTREPEAEEPSDGGDDALRIATYSSMVTGETPAGEWLTDAFTEEYPDAELRWRVPDAGIEHFIRRGQLEAEADVGADVYLGLTVGELVRVDAALGEGALFEPLDRDRLEHDGRVRDDLAFGDPADRVVPFDTGYLTLVYDEDALEEGPPTSFDDLLKDGYADALLAQDPRASDPGLAFLLWTIAEYGDDYLSFWRSLRDNGVGVRERWTDAYRDAYLDGRRPMVVSYSTDRVGAADAGRELRRHQTATLEGRAFENPEGIAVFADTPRPERAYEFVDFVLSEAAQAEIALRNVQFPAVEDEYVDLDETFATYATEPESTVTTSYEELRGDLEEWLTAWDEAFAGTWEANDRRAGADEDENGDGDENDGGMADEDGGDADGGDADDDSGVNDEGGGDDDGDVNDEGSTDGGGGNGSAEPGDEATAEAGETSN